MRIVQAPGPTHPRSPSATAAWSGSTGIGWCRAPARCPGRRHRAFPQGRHGATSPTRSGNDQLADDQRDHSARSVDHNPEHRPAARPHGNPEASRRSCRPTVRGVDAAGISSGSPASTVRLFYTTPGGRRSRRSRSISARSRWTPRRRRSSTMSSCRGCPKVSL